MDAQKLHKDSIVFDAHSDTLLAVVSGERRLGERSKKGHIDLPRMIKGGLSAQIFAACVMEPMLPVATKWALRLLDTFYQELEANEGKLKHALKAADIEEAKASKVPAALLSLEGSEPLMGDLGLLRIFHRLGIRAITFTWNWRNQAADGVGENRTGGGLTHFGVDLVAEMNRLGMMVDIAHLSPAGIRDVFATTSAPVIDSHTGATALCDHRRNLTDDQLEGLARNGGVACVCYVPSFMEPNASVTSLEKVLDHIDHMVEVMGPDHVGLGSDFDGFGDAKMSVTGLEDVTRLPSITEGLAARGYKAEDIRKILGGNLMRVFRHVAG